MVYATILLIVHTADRYPGRPTTDRLHVSVLRVLCIRRHAEGTGSPVPFQLCIFTHPVVYFSAIVLYHRFIRVYCIRTTNWRIIMI